METGLEKEELFETSNASFNGSTMRGNLWEEMSWRGIFREIHLWQCLGLSYSSSADGRDQGARGNLDAFYTGKNCAIEFVDQ